MPMQASVQISRRSQAALIRCQQALGLYARSTSRTPTRFIAAATSKLLLGEDDEGGNHTPGLYERIADTAPAVGTMAAAAEARGYRMGLPDSTSLSLARSRVNELLGRGESGAFTLQGGKFGHSWKLGSIYSRGAKKGQVNVRGSRSKTAIAAVGVGRAAARAAGASLLNRQALIVAIAIRRREAARLATAVQFLPATYRSTIKRVAGLTYRSGNAVGYSSADYSAHRIHERKLVQNGRGTVLGSLDLSVIDGAAFATVIGELGLHTAGQRAALADSLDVVADHALLRVLERVKVNSDDFHAALQLTLSRT